MFVAKTIQNYLDHLTDNPELASILFYISNTLMDLPMTYITEANEEDKVCERIASAMEVIATYSSSLQLHKVSLFLFTYQI